MSNPSWCRLSFCSRFHYEQREDSICRENCCHYTKMTFFEAWEKAKEGDRVEKESCSLFGAIKSINTRFDKNRDMYIERLFEKEWIIIPKKKTVTITIPEGAKNEKVFYSDGVMLTNVRGGVKKITYET